MKSRRRLTTIVVLLIVGAGLTMAVFLRGRGIPGGAGLSLLLGDTKAAIEQWCGKQMLAIANAHLRPQLSFDKLQFELPATATLTNVKLVDQNTTVINAKAMRIEFTETPKVGQPMVIQNIELIDPVVRLIQRKQGGLLGLSDIVKKPARDTTAEGLSIRLSDVFAIRRIGVINGSISLELTGRPAMVLDQVTCDFISKPANEDPSQQGWYTIDARLSRPQILDWAMTSRLNIDTAVLDIKEATWSMKLEAEQYAVLPPDLQTLVRRHEITGDFAAKLSGTLALKNIAASVLDMQITLTKGHMIFDEYVLPVHSLDMTANLSGGTLSIKPLTLASLGGTLQMDGTVNMQGEYPFTMNVDVHGMRIEDALKPVEQQPPKYAGRVDLDGTVGGNLGVWPASADGTGKLSIAEGRLIHVPALMKINEMAGGEAAADSATDHGSADLQLFGDHVSLTNIDVISSAVAARGEGEIMFDSTISFRLNAGPLERVQSGLGKIGELFGKVTDQIVQYEVTGTLGDPVVTVKTLGIDLGIGK